MMLFGLKTDAWFDLWSFEHFFSGMSIATMVIILGDKILRDHLPKLEYLPVYKRFYYVMLLLVAYMWEAIEFYLEAGYTHIESVTYWLHGVEFWGNRLITDPIITLLGGVIALKIRPAWLWTARLLSIAWLLANLFLVPHSMCLQEKLDNWMLQQGF